MNVCYAQDRGPHWPRAVVFDLDGTLVDSIGDLADALNATFAGRGLPQLPEDRIKEFVGAGIPELVRRGLLESGVAEDDLESCIADMLERYSARPAARTRLYDGAAELLASLRGAGVKLGVCTNKPQRITETVLQEMGIAVHFGAVVGESPARPRKPDPAMLRAVLDALEVAAFDALMVGDSGSDVSVARALGMPVIVLRSGYGRDAPEDLGADRVIDSLRETEEVIAALRIGAS